MGRSGAGKSTLLTALAGLTPLDEGEIAVDARVLDLGMDMVEESA